MARNGRARFGVQESVQGALRDQSGCMLKVGVQTLRGCLLGLVECRDSAGTEGIGLNSKGMCQKRSSPAGQGCSN